MDGFYVPALAPAAETWELEAEISFMNAIISSLDPADPQYVESRAHYERELNRLYIQLTQCEAPASSSAYQLSMESPGEGSVISSGSGPGSRKRTRDNTPGGTPGTPMSIEYSVPGAWPDANPPTNGHTNRADASRTPLLGGDYIDLTGDDDIVYPEVAPGPVALDPFPELVHGYQPDQSFTDPSNAFDQEWLSVEDLAQYLIAPTPAGGAYAYNQPDQANAVGAVGTPRLTITEQASRVVRPRNVDLEDELFGDLETAVANETPEAVQDLIQNIKNHDDLQPEMREPTPNAMSSTLMEHQRIALTWLLKMERGKSKGGILADDMGLGKTVQALALMLAHPSQNPACKTTLIVAPIALMRQWQKEIERHVKPGHRLTVYIYHGSGKNADFQKLRKHDVVLTTFGTLSSELKQKEARHEAEAAMREQQDARYVRPTRETLALLGRECMWYRVVLDEAQCIKNRSTLVSKATNDLQAQYRLCMTGTPMMNSVEELFPLIRFLKIPPYHDWGRFSSDISRPLKANKATDRVRNRAMNRVQALLKSIMLRRGKNTLVDGKKICEIPPKHTNLQSVEFSDEEQALYKAIETNSQVKFNRYLEAGTVNNHYANVLVMLLRLRQVCCHPHLIKDLGVQVSTEAIAEDDLLERARQLTGDVVRRLREADGFECPICYEIDANPTIFIPCGHTCCGECFQKLIDPTQAIREGNENSGPKCPHCRSPLSSTRITDYEHFCKEHCPWKLKELGFEADSADASPDPGNPGSDSVSDSDDDPSDDDDDLKDFIVPDDYMSDTDMKEEADMNEEVAREKRDGKRKAKAKAKAKPTVTLAQLKKDSLRNKAAKKKYLKRLRKTFVSSAKIEKTMELLTDIRAQDPTEKTLVFSQWTALLDLLEVPLAQGKFKYQRYDGSMRMNDRVDVVNQFMDDTDENIMLISLKAGNAGLNLNKASQVIILDPFWNPFIEDQAVDRAHRMPQKKEVQVHRVLVPETVEDRICALQDKKREIINAALDETIGKSLTRLSIGELRYLFGLSDRA